MFAVNINGTGLKKKKSSQEKEKKKQNQKEINQPNRNKTKNPKSQNDVGAIQTGENTLWSCWAYSPGQFLVFFFLYNSY